MKTKDKQRLYADLIKYSDQIGIYPEERPRLILDRKEYHALKVSNGEPRRAGWYGECNRELQTIFLDAGKRHYHYGIYRKLRKNSNEQEMYKDIAKGYGYRNQVIYHNTTDYSNEDNRQTYYRFHHDGRHYTETREAKGNYKSKLHCMISLLVYYRFPYMQHGKKSEQRVKEILKGKQFELKHIDAKKEVVADTRL
ncbi:MAG: hypothetical protein M3044_17885 [Thermoproteota archaeon]|nr:hypothetical protein [Thermoproteota archaeon]